MQPRHDFDLRPALANSMCVDYEYYQTACWNSGVSPMPFWQFRLAYSFYLKHFYSAVEFDLETGDLQLKPGYLPMVKWTKFRRLAKAVDEGRQIAQAGRRWDDLDDDRGGPAVREPRRPVPPRLDGSAARSFDGPVYESDRDIVR